MGDPAPAAPREVRSDIATTMPDLTSLCIGVIGLGHVIRQLSPYAGLGQQAPCPVAQPAGFSALIWAYGSPLYLN